MKRQSCVFAALAALVLAVPLAQSRAADPEEGRLLKPVAEIDISKGGIGSRMWLGDLTGDGRYEFVMAQPNEVKNNAHFPLEAHSLTAYNLEGKVLWQVGEPSANAKSGSDIPVQLYDIDNDGQIEVLAAMNDTIRIFDGKTGELEKTLPLPNENAHDCLLIADLKGDGHPSEIIVKDRYHRLWALDADGKVLFEFEGNLGHYGWPYDLDGDGRDELIFGYHVLGPDGKERWKMDLKGHADAVWVADVDGRPENGVEIVVGGDGTYLYDKNGRQLWAYEGTVESQNAFPGQFRPDLPGLEIGGLDRIDRGDPGLDGLFLLNSEGKELFKEKRPVPGWSSIATVVRDFDDMPGDLFLAYRRGGGLGPGLYDGEMKRRYRFPKELEDAQFMYGDLLGTGRSQIIAYTDGGIAQIFTSDNEGDVSRKTGESRKQPKRLYNWTRYWGSETPVSKN